MLLHIHPDNPQPRQIKTVVECLNDGGVIIYPTDTIYGLGCNIMQHKAVEKICTIKGIKPEKAQLSFVCSDLSHLSDYTKAISTPLYRTLKEYLPGAFTFILPASKQVPKILQTKKNTIGLRIPNHPICLQIVKELGQPILSASLPDGTIETYTDPETIYETYKNRVDIIIDAGVGGITSSTIIDCTTDNYEVIREGLGVWNG
jgi:tRNA threonylcarbamoyl adenosine modification protein (Sua5/YciO/YrdC/YwlC family)